LPERITPTSAVRLYVDYLNYLLNRLLTDGRLQAFQHGSSFIIERYQAGEYRPLELTPQGFLHFSQFVTRVDTHIQVEWYSYIHSMSPDRDDEDAWICRYEYKREASNPRVPRGHLHINVKAPKGWHLKRPLKRTHFPTMRMSVEHLIWHLIEECGVTPKIPRKQVLKELASSYSGFTERRTEPVGAFP
jgi:hypothetical protein